MLNCTERLVEAVETAKNNKMLELEYMSYYANMHDKYNEGLKAGLSEGFSDGLNEGFNKGLNKGLSAMVKTLKPILKDFDKVYNAVAETEEYADITREEVMEYYQKCP